MKRKTLHTLLSCVALLLACLMVLASCSKKPAEEPGNSNAGTTAAREPATNAPGEKDDPTPGGEGPMTVLVDNLVVNSSSTVVTIEKAELSVDLDGGKLNGNGYAKGSVVAYGSEISFDGAAVVKDGSLYMTAKADPNGAEENAEAYILSLTDTIFESLSDSGAPAGQIVAMIPGMFPQITTLMEEKLLPELAKFAEAHPEMKDMSEKVMGLAFTIEETESGYTVALSFDKLLETVELFNTKKVSELVDYILGEGEYTAIKTYANGIFSKTVGELLNDLKEEKIDVAALLEMVNTVLPADEQGNTQLSAVLAQLKDEKFLATTIGQLLTESETPLTAEQIAALQKKMAPVFNAMEEMTVWDAVEALVSKIGGSGSEPSEPDTYDAEAGDEPATGLNLYEMVKGALTQYKDTVKLTYKTDKNGMLLSMELELNVVVTAPSEEEAADAEPQVMFAATGKVEIVKNHKSTVDYDKTVTTVEGVVKNAKDNQAKIAELIKADIKDDYDDAVVNYNAETGAMTIHYTVYMNGQYGLYGRTVMADATRTVDITLDMNTIAMLTVNDVCSDLRTMSVVYKQTVNVNFEVEYLRWDSTSGMDLSPDEQTAFIASRKQSEKYSVELALKENGEYSLYDYSADPHDFPETPTRTETDPDNENRTIEYYVCTKCGYTNVRYIDRDKH